MIKWFHPDPNVKLERKHEGDSGFDLIAYGRRSPTISSWSVEPGRRLCLDTGLHLEMPSGIEGQVRSRSGLARDLGLVAVAGTVDSGYRGPISVVLINHGEAACNIVLGMRIAQLVLSPVVIPGELMVTGSTWNRWPVIVRVDSLERLAPSTRGSSGFGSTGVR